jgi:hypothetical protein
MCSSLASGATGITQSAEEPNFIRPLHGYPAARLADLLPWNWKPAVNA